MNDLFRVDKLNFSYDGKEVFNELSFEVKENEFVSLLFASGTGKSTLINLLSGLLPSNDCISLGDILLTRRSGKKYLKNIGVVFENLDDQFLTDVVYDELVLPLSNLNYSKKDIKLRLNEVVDMLEISDLLDYYVDSLSDFNKVKVLLACSLMHRPKILFLDDIFRGLKDEEKKEILVKLKMIVDLNNISVVLVTSDLEDTLYSNNIYVVDDKKNAFNGTINEVLEYDNRLSKLGIKIPVMIDVSLKLKFYDLLEDVILDEEKMVDILWN